MLSRQQKKNYGYVGTTRWFSEEEYKKVIGKKNLAFEMENEQSPDSDWRVADGYRYHGFGSYKSQFGFH